MMPLATDDLISLRARNLAVGKQRPGPLRLPDPWQLEFVAQDD